MKNAQKNAPTKQAYQKNEILITQKNSKKQSDNIKAKFLKFFACKNP